MKSVVKKLRSFGMYIALGGAILFNPSQASAQSPRDYWAHLTQEQHESLGFILASLSQKSIPQLISNRPRLRKAGAKLRDIHPLRYIHHIFGHDDYIHNLSFTRNRSYFIWPGFLYGEDNGETDGMIGSLKQEDRAGNIKPEHIRDLANSCNLSYNRMSICIRQKQWDEFMTYIVNQASLRCTREMYDI